jgi:NADH/F420H2 dehydrogenase subunit C
MHPIAQKIRERFPQAIVGESEFRGELTVVVQKDRILPVCRYLHDDPDLGFDHITDVTAVDWSAAEVPGREDENWRFEVVYHLYSVRHRRRIRIKARLPEEPAEIETVTGIWKGANFMERETYDLMGIRFKNHPDLRRMFLPEDYDGHPLRKEYPAEGKGWRNRFEFLTITNLNKPE